MAGWEVLRELGQLQTPVSDSVVANRPKEIEGGEGVAPKETCDCVRSSLDGLDL